MYEQYNVPHNFHSFSLFVGEMFVIIPIFLLAKNLDKGARIYSHLPKYLGCTGYQGAASNKVFAQECLILFHSYVEKIVVFSN